METFWTLQHQLDMDKELYLDSYTNFMVPTLLAWELTLLRAEKERDQARKEAEKKTARVQKEQDQARKKAEKKTAQAQKDQDRTQREVDKQTARVQEQQGRARREAEKVARRDARTEDLTIRNERLAHVQQNVNEDEISRNDGMGERAGDTT